TVMSSDGLSAKNRPMSDSLRPSPYTSAVSKNVTPAWAAASSTARASASRTSPQSAPSCQVPRPIAETGRPVRPRVRISMPRRYLIPTANNEALSLLGRGLPLGVDGRRHGAGQPFAHNVVIHLNPVHGDVAHIGHKLHAARDDELVERPIHDINRGGDARNVGDGGLRLDAVL